MQHELFNKRPELLKMASTPVHLEMMCAVWKTNEHFGCNLAELYEKFVMCLVDHYEKRENIQPRTPEKEIPKKYRGVFLSLGDLANQWNEAGVLQTTFSYQTLCDKTEEHKDVIIALGCVTKYHPSFPLSTSCWAFTHLTFQEYFLAYLIATKECAEKTRIFYNIKSLEKHTVVFKFLAGMAPFRANEMLFCITKKAKGQSDCKRLLRFLLNIITEYSDVRKFNIPLPGFIDIDLLMETPKKIIKIMFEKDYLHHRNVQYLKTSHMADPSFQSALGYLQTLDVTFRSTYSLTSSADLILKCENIKHLKIDFQIDQIEDVTDVYMARKSAQDFLMKLSGKSLESLTVTGTNILSIVSPYLNCAPSISSLVIKEKGRRISEKGVETFCDGAQLCQNLTCVQLDTEKLTTALLKLKPTLQVSLYAKATTDEDLRSFVKQMISKPETCGVALANLSGSSEMRNDLRGSASEINTLIKLMGPLRSLYLEYCNLTEETLSKLALCMEEEQVVANLQVLSLSNNTLCGGGQFLGSILQYLPQLQTLNICGCRFDDKDMTTIATALKPLKHLINLGLRGNNIEESSASALGDAFHHLKDLEVLDVAFCKMTTATISLLAAELRQQCLQHLRVLDVAANFYSDKGMWDLAPVFSFLPSLQALSVASCGCEDVDVLLHLISNIPPTLTHLDVSYNWGPGAVQAVQEKEQLAQLHRLNIGDPNPDVNHEETVEAVRQELLMLNPQTEVYCNYLEHMWDIYVNLSTEESS